jgi:hypothetical protein
MRYLAVAEMPPHGFWSSLRHRGQAARRWHAVADTFPKPIKTLCGFSYAAEAHRTWDQTTWSARCPTCQRLTTTADKARVATFISERAISPRRP